MSILKSNKLEVALKYVQFQTSNSCPLLDTVRYNLPSGYRFMLQSITEEELAEWLTNFNNDTL